MLKVELGTFPVFACSIIQWTQSIFLHDFHRQKFCFDTHKKNRERINTAKIYLPIAKVHNKKWKCNLMERNKIDTYSQQNALFDYHWQLTRHWHKA